jgi:hypothetical protein
MSEQAGRGLLLLLLVASLRLSRSFFSLSLPRKQGQSAYYNLWDLLELKNKNAHAAPRP